jgi:thymidine kinase
MESVTNGILVSANFILSVKMKFSGKTASLLKFLYEKFSYRRKEKKVFISSVTSGHRPQ